MKRRWWGYQHINGTIRVKPFLGQLDIDDANQSPFVAAVVPFVKAGSAEEAEQLVAQKLGVTRSVVRRCSCSAGHQ